MKYIVVIEKGRELGYFAYCSALKGCVSQGATRDETLSNIQTAVEVYVEAPM